MSAKGLSLHIGVNAVDPAHYAGWSGPLSACERDAEAIHALAQKQGFGAQLLETREATRSAVKDAIKESAASLQEGDFFLLSYSGHGGQVRDRNGDEEDLSDETWCLYDGELIDDELDELWAAFAPRVRIVVLSDSCHSGTVIRKIYDKLVKEESERLHAAGDDENVVVRMMPDEEALKTYRANREFYDGLVSNLPLSPSPVKCTVRLISGCQDDELSYEGGGQGRFTSALLTVWDDGNFEGNYDDFHQSITAETSPRQQPNHMIIGHPSSDFNAQRPFMI